MAPMIEGIQERRLFQFSLRTFFVGMLVFAVMLVIARLIPIPVSVFLAGAMPAPILTALAIRYRVLQRFTIFAALVLAWLVFYVVSIGPVAGVGMWLGLERQPMAQAVVHSFYAPVLFLYDVTPLAEWYTDFWQHLGMQLR